MSFDIPLFIVISFLLSTAVIVFYSIKRFTTFRVYAVGNRQFSTVSLIATTLATYYGGAMLIGYLSMFSFGPFWLSRALFAILIPFLMLSWLSKRMSKFIYQYLHARDNGPCIWKISKNYCSSIEYLYLYYDCC